MHITLQPDAGPTRMGMLEDVVQAFLNDAVEIHGGFLRKNIVHRIQLALKVNPAGIGGTVNHRFEGAGQSQMIHLWRMQITGNLAHFGDRRARQIIDGLHLLAQFRRLVPDQRELGAIFDQQQVLAKAVVQFGGDA